MSDKIIEDIYNQAKTRPWGIAAIGFFIICFLVFSVWNSLPDSVKEKYLLSTEDHFSNGKDGEEKKGKQNVVESYGENKLSGAQYSQVVSLRPDGKPYRNATQEAQFLLRELGYPIGFPDGFEGPATTAALEDFQRKHNLPITGAADEATIAVVRLRAEKAFLRKKG